MKVGRRDEKKGQRSNTTHSHFLFSISHSLGLMLNPSFCGTLTLKSYLYPKPVRTYQLSSFFELLRVFVACSLSRETAAQ